MWILFLSPGGAVSFAAGTLTGLLLSGLQETQAQMRTGTGPDLDAPTGGASPLSDENEIQPEQVGAPPAA